MIRACRLAIWLSFLLVQGGSAMAASCRDEAGKQQAQTYVDQCLEVSPATHPPCNADNDCQMIIDEIVRGCEFLKEDAPGFCSDYGD